MNKENEIEIEVLQANEGDCILISVKSDIHILIDGGTKETYKNSLKNRLIQLKNEGKEIDLLVVTHIDNDHIGGIIELLKENVSNEKSEIIRIKNIWHNSYRHLQFKKKGNLKNTEKQILDRIIFDGETNLNYDLSVGSNISAVQGTTLAALVLDGGYSWNKQFEENAIYNNGMSYQFGSQCYISVLLPDISDLEKLAKKWKRDLQKSKFSFEFSEDRKFDDAFEYYCRYLNVDGEGDVEKICYEEDKIEEMAIEEIAMRHCSADNSITNKSSISLLIRYKKKRLLFLADNIADNAIQQLSQEYRECILVKLPHHGSANNITNNFLHNIDSEIFLVSTNSEKYNHPDIETLAKIACKRTEYTKKIFFNYSIEKVLDFEKKIQEMRDIEFIYLEKGQRIYL